MTYPSALFATRKMIKYLGLFCSIVLLISSCKKKEDDDPTPTKTIDFSANYTSGISGVMANGQHYSLEFAEGSIDKGNLKFKAYSDFNSGYIEIEAKGVDESGDYDVQYAYWDDERGDFEKIENTSDALSIDSLSEEALEGRLTYTNGDLVLTGTISLNK